MRDLFSKYILKSLVLALLCWLGTGVTCAQEQYSFSGTVLDAQTGLPLDFISIKVIGTTLHENTGEDGTFSFNNDVPLCEVEFSYPTFLSQKKWLKTGEPITIFLHSDDGLSLLPGVNQGAYVLDKGSYSGSYDVVEDPRTLAQSPAVSFDEFLQGKSAGLQSIRKNGMPGQGSDMLLRGFSSLYTSNKPLVLVDGLPVNEGFISNMATQGYELNPLSQIELRDIERITVLKGASAGLYGSKGANGVIAIDTYLPQGGKTTFDFSAYAGVANSPRGIPMLDSEAHKNYLVEMMLSEGMSMNGIRYKYKYLTNDVSNPDYLRTNSSTDWYNDIMRPAMYQGYNLGIKGGDEMAKYSFGIGYLNHEGGVENTNLSRFSVRFNSEIFITQKLVFNSNVGLTFSEANLMEQGMVAETNPFYAAHVKAKFFTPNRISDDGAILPIRNNPDELSFSNPLAIIDGYEGVDNNYRLLAKIGLTYNFSPVFALSTRFGYDLLKSRNNIFVPSLGIASRANGAYQQTSSSATNMYQTTYNESMFSMKKRIDQHHVSAYAGVRFKSDRQRSDRGTAYNSGSDEFKGLEHGNPNYRNVGGFKYNQSWNDLFVSANYSFRDKYSVLMNINLDHASVFGNNAGDVDLFGKGYAFLPSASVAWKISSENFLYNANFIDLLRVRANAGLSGNDDLGINAGELMLNPVSYGSVTGLTRTSIPNNDLTWETMFNAGVGMDAAFLRNRLSFSYDYYQSTTSDMITYEALPPYYGFTYFASNGGEMQNMGHEVALNARIIDRAFKLDLGIQGSTNLNQITSLKTDSIVFTSNEFQSISIVGEAAGSYYGYQTNGVYATAQAAEAAGLVNEGGIPFGAGDVIFVDQNGDNQIDEKDKVIIGNPNPEFFGSFSTSLQYKRWKLYAKFYGVYGNDVYNRFRRDLESMTGYENQTVAVANRWRTEGQVTDMPRVIAGDPMDNSRFSDRWIEDGSYLRLQTLTFSYTVPEKIWKLNSAMIYVTGSNLWTYTKYLGVDPEFSSSSHPQMQGVDSGYFPQMKSVIIGVKIGL